MRIWSSSRSLLTVVSLVVVFVTGSLPLSTVMAQEQAGCFSNVPGVTNCISNRFLDFWNSNGGLSVYGYPITGLLQEANQAAGQVYDTQWFERNRFEYHADLPRPYDVQISRLGADLLAARGIDWQTLPKAQPSDAHYFRETGHAITNPAFWSYWSNNGLRNPDLNAFQRSLALFGYPISEPQMETSANGEMVLTQWFERARFEYHPNAGGQPQVLLGLLGNELYSIISQAGAVQLTDADNGKSIALQLNQTLVVTLESNRSTSSSWQVTEVSQGILRQQTEPEYRAGGSTPGSPGTETFRFTVVGTGQTRLMLTYQRSAKLSPQEPEYIFAVNVTVQ